MMNQITPTCTTCGKAILGEDVNVAKDIAYCRTCNLAHELSALIRASELMGGVDVNRPPPGVRCDIRSGSLLVVATHRAVGTAIGALAFALFWNGIVSVFVLIAIAGTLHNLHVPAPAWFPAPEMNGSSMSVGMTVFMWLFLTPFIVIGALMIGAFFLTIGGRTEVQVEQGEGSVFTGVGPLGYRRRFSAVKVVDVRIDDRQWRDSDGDRQRKTYIVVETREGKLIRFGTLLSEERRRFVAGSLRKALVR